MVPPKSDNTRLHEVALPVPESTPAPLPPAPPKKNRLPLVFGSLALLVAAFFGVKMFMARGNEVTDDSQIEADVVQVGARIPGQISEVFVREDAHVEAGQPLVRLDDADLQAKASQAEAELQTTRAQLEAAAAQIGVARATLTRSEAEAEKARLDFERAEELRRGGAIATQQFDTSRIADVSSKAGTGANRAQYSVAVANESLAKARVKSAEAALKLANLQLSYTVIRAPTSGTISKLSARVGELIQAGQALGELVPENTYVLANFKETQTANIRPGQRADVDIDAYPGHTLTGTVESLSGGTGAQFALLPPDNSSGNFVKVVERVPVRVAWAKVPDVVLRAGLSATVTVHTR